MPEFPEKVIAILAEPIDQKALSRAPKGLTSIKSIYITERLNRAFGFGRWYVEDHVISVTQPPSFITRDGEEKTPGQMVVVKANLELYDYPWFKGSSYGGNNNDDLGDAYKGAISDALSTICARYLGVAIDVFKGQAELSDPRVQKVTVPLAVVKPTAKPDEMNQEPPKPGVNDADGPSAINLAKANRFRAIARANHKTGADVKSVLTAAGLTDIDKCPWKGDLYDKLCEWAGTNIPKPAAAAAEEPDPMRFLS